MSQINRIGESGPSRIEYNPASTDFSQARIDLRELPQNLRDNEVYNNLIETNNMASELEKMLINMLSPNDPALRIERDIERLLTTYELDTGLNLSATHGDLFAKSMLTIREYYEFAGVVPGENGEAHMTGNGHADVMQLRAESQRGGFRNFVARNLGLVTGGGGGVAGAAAGAGVASSVNAAALYGSIAGGAAVATGIGLGTATALTGGLALVGIGVAMGFSEMATLHARTRRLAQIQTHLDNVSSELIEQREEFKNLELALNNIATATSTPPILTSSRAEDLNSTYSTKIKALCDNLLVQSTNGIPDIRTYLTEAAKITEDAKNTDTAIATLDALDPTQAGTVSFTSVDLTNEQIAATKNTDIDAIITLANGNHSAEQLAALITQKTTKWTEIPTHLATLTDYNTQMETRKANLLAAQTEDTPARRKLIRYADRVIAKTKTDARARINNQEFSVLNSFESYFDQVASNDVKVTDYPFEVEVIDETTTNS